MGQKGKKAIVHVLRIARRPVREVPVIIFEEISRAVRRRKASTLAGTACKLCSTMVMDRRSAGSTAGISTSACGHTQLPFIKAPMTYISETYVDDEFGFLFWLCHIDVYQGAEVVLLHL